MIAICNIVEVLGILGAFGTVALYVYDSTEAR